MGRCLVIGASSFIGAYTVDAFREAGYEVVGTGRNPRFKEHYASVGVGYLPLDLDDPAGMDVLPTDVDVVVHLAGRLPANSTFDLESEDDAGNYLRTNALGMASLLEWCRRSGIGRIISTTSYADVQNRWSAHESVLETWPRDFRLSGDHAAYVISKNAACDLLTYYNNQYGMKNAAFRLPPVYGCGPHDSLRVNGAVRKSGIGLFVDKAKAGEPITVFGDAEAAVRDIVYVKDVAQAFVRAAGSEKTSGLYNIGSGRAVSLLEQAEAIADVFAGPMGKSAVSVDPDKPNGITSYRFDIGRARRDFGYSPAFADFRDLMADWRYEEERGVMPALFRGGGSAGNEGERVLPE
ncbi:NAD-dependent epimerase/dehydratase family protein [Adlercreutzia faecimuris]|uniref:NAD(P)-dependent oxidoreductase n=1 Tax=Adlercreutzia faecimuris TaxID=2897341 RepID=A0ABS9WHA8_9ACTN|nr:NAD(P)-dependent oxidoreductase [Adlercreutzia sp. JBNU-10]MCI2242263.1 NAD(P)-dependent oxidoreductase [Adlercreutzia sp. JBNU-10]